MKRTIGFISTMAFSIIAILAIGCGSDNSSNSKTTKNGKDEVAEVRSKLAADDRALVDAQEWCVVSNDERLGSMGPPIKLDIKGQSVFICCKGCKTKAEANPDKTLAKLEELKAKKKANSAAR